MTNRGLMMTEPLSKTINLVWPNDIKYGSVLLPLGLGYIAAYLSERGIEVKVHDYTFERTKVLSKERAIYGIATTSPLWENAKRIIKDIKTANPNNIIIAGGPHATIMQENILVEAPIDYIVVGEGEETFYRLCTALLNDSPVQDVKGIYYRTTGGAQFTERADLIKDLDTLPPPRYDLFPVKQYMDIRPIKELNMITTRGCPSNCTFCQPYLRDTFGLKIRCRSPKNIVDEIVKVQREFRPHLIVFCDDMVIPHHIREVCNEIIRRKVRVVWRCLARVGLDTDLLRLMKKAGCINIAFGVESGSPKVLEALNKNITREGVIQQFHECRKVGMFAHAFFMVGNPGENWEDIEKTIDLIDKMKPFSIYAVILTPYPGSYIFNRLRQEKRLPENIDWSTMNQYKDNTFFVNISEISKDDVVKAKHLVMERFKNSNRFSRIQYLLSYVKDLDGIRTLLFFVIDNPSALLRVARTVISISKSGAGLDATKSEGISAS